jgi:anti-sigma regulatory factor (Ser/Thr protein kinase)
LDFTIHSDFPSAKEVQRAIINEAESLGFGQNKQFEIKLAIEEALITSIKHRHQLRRERIVQIHAEFSAINVVIVVQDEVSDPVRLVVWKHSPNQ